jgi:hypothetical protein
LIPLLLASMLFVPDAEVLAPAPDPGPATWADLGDELAALNASLALAEASLLGARSSDWRWQECRFQSLEYGVWTPREERLTGLCTTKRWPVPGGFEKLSAVVACESGWARKAYNPAGPYVGLGQIGDWPARYQAFRFKDWKLEPRWQNSRTMLVVVSRWAHSVGWGAWSCG